MVEERYIEQIIEKYADMVYKIALTRCRTVENAEDIFQEVFMKFSSKMPAFKSEEHEKAWFIRVTINLSKNFKNLAWNKKVVILDENIEFEIIVADDCSKTELPRLHLINQLSNCQLIKPQHNLGRAKIRNFLANKSQYNHLLFLDSDSFPANNNFLKNYIDFIPQNLTILGGRIYNDAQDEHHTLLTKYGIIKERNNNPVHISNAPFTSPNFLIHKIIFNKIRFNENIKGYGHEDTIFGIELSRLNIPYYRFDNPIIHLQIEDNQTFIHKTNESIQNLYNIYKTKPINPNLIIRLKW